MTTVLEQRYRTVLRLLPSYYRAEREEEMVETYLHGIDEQHRDEMRPAWGEVASIAALAIRTRMGAAGAPARYATLGATVRLFALLSMLLHAASALTERALLLTWVKGAPAQDRELFLGGFTGHGAVQGLYEAASWLLPLAWAVAYLALLRDHRRTAFVFAVLAALPDLASLMRHAGGGPDTEVVSLWLTTAVFSWLTVLALCCGFHRDAPPARLPLASPGLALMGTCVLMGASIVVWPGVADPGWAGGSAFIAAAAVWLVVRCRSPKHVADPALPLALATLGLAILVQRIPIVAFPAQNAPGSVIAAATVQAGIIVVLAAALTTTGTRSLTVRFRSG
ncbi:hypothetical protein BX264_3328 [Streptomyces sp. 2333.5]|uniref:hypothetical protein n=1 Tax=unclassified Streptomyces TaxID=2593676 RepID=UPI00089C8763|nr:MULTISPECIES: hypothetical protein [unclassified Streptomyces]PJJ02962.1 hypothetical protein BX264_3328 [Streptomyces sp. 2333.5]SEE23506.1 hypothetical protein SAMN05428942_3431 [Streptomyces sp. 2112.2]